MSLVRFHVALIAALSAIPALADDAKPPPAVAGVQAAIFLRQSCAPAYPDAALKARATGITRVRFTIQPDATIANAEVAQSSGELPENKLMDQAAVDALSKCPIRAGRDPDGQPVGGQIVVTYEWKIAPR